MGSMVSSLGNMFGAGPSGDTNGLNFQARGTNILQPTTEGQATGAYDQSQQALQQQQAFLQALQAQNGIQNQSSVFNQMQGVENGTGPNPAQAMLSQATGNNIASTAALIAGQRGASANPALIARQAAMQGANLNQQAAGQGASMQAQQSLAALGQLGGMANQQVANQAAATQGYNQAAQSEQQNLLNAIQGQNNANVSMQGNLNSANAGVSESLIPVQNKNIGTLTKALPMVGSMMAHGGEVKKMADGGDVMPSSSGPQSFVGQHFALFGSAPSSMSSAAGPQIQGAPQPGVVAEPQDSSGGKPSMPGGGGQSVGGNPLSGGMPTDLFGGADASGVMAGGPMDAIGGGAGAAAGGAEAGGLMAEAAPLVMLANKGGAIPKKPVNGEKLAAKGKEVPGKAKVKGDSLKNDIVDAKLSPGEIVIPRSIAQGPNAPAQAAAFVQAILAKKGIRRGV